MCQFAALGLLAPRLILLLMCLFNSSFVMQPFSGMAVPNPVLPITGLLLMPVATLVFCWASFAFGGVSTFNSGLVVAIGVIIDLGLIGNGRGLAKC